jgi:hypothetical protein
VPAEDGYELRHPWLYEPFHLAFLGDVALYRLQARLTFGQGGARTGWLLSVVLIGLWG